MRALADGDTRGKAKTDQTPLRLRSSSYDARPPKDIKFAPLNKEIEYNGEELMELYDVRLVLVCFYIKKMRPAWGY